MAQPQQNIQARAPGFAGLNTQDSPVGLDLSWAAVADNCVIDAHGRIASRKGQAAFTVDPETVGNMDDNPVETVYEYVQADGTRTVLLSGFNDSSVATIWNQNTSGVLTVVTGLTASSNNWSYTSLSDVCFLVQAGEVIQETDGITIGDMAEQPSAVANGVVSPNVILAAYGHLFVADGLADKSTVQWSVITTNAGLGATPWTGAGAGLINVEEYWPNGSDEIVGLAAHNNLLVIFGRRSILLYNVPTSANGGNIGPQFMTLQDTIENIGCIARDSIVSIGTDMLFLDSSGLRSLNRTIQEKSVPIGDMSMNVRDDLSAVARAANFPIRGVYSPEESVYLLFIPRVNDSLTQTFVFDTRRPLENGALRVTRWPGRGIRCGVRVDSGNLLLGRPGGLYRYTGGDDTSSLTAEPPSSGVVMSYFTHSQNFDEPSRTKFPKQIDIILIGGASLTLQVRWFFDFSESGNTVNITRTAATGAQWNQGEWDVDEYGESGGLITLESVNLWGSGKNVSFGFVGTITEQPVSIQELNIQALLGRVL